MNVAVRRIEPRDEPRWRELWDGYTRFYEREPNKVITCRTWQRILDPAVSMHAIVAVAENDEAIGIANYVIHETTSSLAPVCYLVDLFVDPAVRGAGVGEMMIDWLLAETKAQGWANLYWHTRETNYRARGLYDKYGPHSGFVRYLIRNETSANPAAKQI